MRSERSDKFLADFGYNSADILSKSILKAADTDWKHSHVIPETLVSNSIVLSACLFGSVYLFSTSLIGLNKKWMRNEPASMFEFVNGSILTLSGAVMAITAYKAFGILNNIR